MDTIETIVKSFLIKLAESESETETNGLTNQINVEIVKSIEALDKSNIKEVSILVSVLQELFIWYLQNNAINSIEFADKILKVCESNYRLSVLQLKWISDQYINKSQNYLYAIYLEKLCVLIDNDKERKNQLINTLQVLIESFVNQDHFKYAFKHCLRLLKLLEEQNKLNSFEYAMVNWYTGRCYARLEICFDESESYLRKALEMFENMDQSFFSCRDEQIELRARTYEELGLMYILKANYESAKSNFNLALPLFEKIKDYEKYIYLCFRLSYCDVNAENYSDAYDRIIRLIKEKSGEINFDLHPRFYHLLGFLSELMTNYSEAVEWLEKCITLEQNKWDNDWRDPVCQLGNLYRKISRLDKTNSKLLDKAFDLFSKYNEEITKQHNLPFNLNGSYGFICSLLDVSIDNNNALNESQYASQAFHYFPLKINLKNNNNRIHSVMTSQLFSAANMYRMNTNLDNVRGICVIINNIAFQTPKQWRDGSITDALRLIQMFVDFNYKVIVINDCTKKETLRELRKIAELDDLKLHDSFVCIGLSHGDNGLIYGFDRQKISIYEIFSIFSELFCPNLAKKPKIFIFNACRGTQSGSYVPLDDESGSTNDKNTDDNKRALESTKPLLTDMFVWYATTEGFVAYRDGIRGSIFIDKLSDVFVECVSNTEISVLAKKVECLIDTVMPAKDCKQTTSTVTYGWRKDFYFKQNNCLISEDNSFRISIVSPILSFQSAFQSEATVKDVYDILRAEFGDGIEVCFDVVIVSTKKTLSSYSRESLLNECEIQKHDTIYLQFKNLNA